MSNSIYAATPFDMLSVSFGKETVPITVGETNTAKASHTVVRADDRPAEQTWLFKCKSAAFESVLSSVKCFAKSNHPTLILGECGCGLKQLAILLYQTSGNATKPLLRMSSPIAAAAICDPYEAISNILLESPDPKTWLLEDIDEIPIDRQAMFAEFVSELLRAQSQKKVERVIAVSNVESEELMYAHGFNGELFHKLGVLTVRVPPLRERREDISSLVCHFSQLDGIARQFEQTAIEAMESYDWPGNVAELRNVVIRVGLQSKSTVISSDELGRYWTPGTERSQRSNSDLTLEDAETQLILDTVARCHGNKTHAAARLGISTRTLHNKYKKYRRMGLVD